MPTREALFRRVLRIDGLPITTMVLLLVALFMVITPEVFLGYRIYMTFLVGFAPLVVMAAGLTLLIAAGEIDLSFPSIIALSGWVIAYCIHEHQAPWLGLILALAAGALVGFLNGVLVAHIGVPSIIATLATQFLWGGLTTVFSQGLSYSLEDVEEVAVWKLFVGRIGPLPVQCLWAFGLTAWLWLVLNRRRFGEHLLFIGDNAKVAEIVGVNTKREKTRAFVVMGVLAAFAAVLLTLENKNFFNTQGSGYLLYVMAAVFIGGTSVYGGEASMVGTAAGSFLITMVDTGVTTTGVQAYWVRPMIGVVFLAAVLGHLFIQGPEKRKTRVRWLRGRLGLNQGERS
jgi:simple sugar transport system permease protein